jgi:hypothetical protein
MTGSIRVARRAGSTLIFAVAMVVEAFAALQFVAARQAPRTLRSGLEA